MLDRIAPNNPDAEQATLAAMLIEPESISQILNQNMTKESFYNLSNQIIFQTMVDMYQESEKIDLLTLSTKLQNTGKEIDVGYLISITNSIPTTANVDAYSRSVLQDAERRQLISVGERMQDLGHDRLKSVEDVRNIANNLFEELQRSSQIRDTPIRTSGELFSDVFERFQEAGKSDNPLSGIHSGWSRVNDITCGWQNGNLYLLAARPGVGKTALALNAAINAAEDLKKNQPGKKIIFYSMEQPIEELARRCVCIKQKNVTALDLKRGKLWNKEICYLHKDRYQAKTNLQNDPSAEYLRRQINEIEKNIQIAEAKLSSEIARSMQYLKELPIVWVDAINYNYYHFKQEIRRLSYVHDIGMIFIDHAGQFFIPGKSTYEKASDVAIELQCFCKALNIPFFCLVQLNRKAESREEPIAADLRDSGRFEEVAFVIMLMSRKEEDIIHDGDRCISKTKLKIAKNKDGPCGSIMLDFDVQSFKFTEHNEKGEEY